MAAEGVVKASGRDGIESIVAVMRAHRLEGRTAGAHDIEGRVLVHDLGPDLRKGTVLAARNLDHVRPAGEGHVGELEPGDLHEDIAAARLSAGPPGPNLH